MYFRDVYAVDPDQILFNLFFVENDRLNIFAELPFLKAKDINIELTKQHIEPDNLKIAFKNYGDYQIIKDKFKTNDIVLQFVMYDYNNNNNVQVELYFLTGYDETYNGSNQWDCQIIATDWKGFVEERRMIPHNVIDANPDNPDFNKIRYTLKEKINWVFEDCYQRALLDGISLTKGVAGSQNQNRKMPILAGFYPQLKSDIAIPEFLSDKCSLAEFRKKWCDMSTQGIDWQYFLEKPKVHAYITADNRIIVDYYRQNVIKIVNNKTNDIINNINITNDTSKSGGNAFVESSEKDAVSYLLQDQRSSDRIGTYDLPPETNAYNGNIQTLVTKAHEMVGEAFSTKTFKGDVELTMIPLLNFTPGDIVAFKDFPTEINEAFEIVSINLSSNHDNGFLEFKINETLERPNVWEFTK